jgi:hypothetical protein
MCASNGDVLLRVGARSSQLHGGPPTGHTGRGHGRHVQVCGLHVHCEKRLMYFPVPSRYVTNYLAFYSVFCYYNTQQ